MFLNKKIRKAVRRTLAPSSTVVFMALAEYIDDYNECTLTKGMLSHDTNLSISAIARALKTLENAGAIEIIQQYHMRDGGNATNLYRLRVDAEFWEQKAAESENVKQSKKAKS